jgi:ribose 5-phosphate isomerase B
MAGAGLRRRPDRIDPQLLSQLAPELDVVHRYDFSLRRRRKPVSILCTVPRVKVAVAFDHRGVHLRDKILETLREADHEVVDLGTDTDAVRIDYPDKAAELGASLKYGQAERGVLVCGSGVGASVAACKIAGIRAAICHDVYSAHQGVEHDDMNVLCLGSEVVGPSLAADLIRAFLGAEFDGGERYVRRLEKVEAMEREMSDGQVKTA